MNRLGILSEFATTMVSAWNEEKPSRMAAALAYYGMFSIVPVVYIAIKVAGYFISDQLLSQQVSDRLTIAFGPETVSYIQDLLTATEGARSGGSFFATFMSFAAILYSASGLFTHLQYSLNKIWHVSIENQGGLVNTIKNRLLAFVLVFAGGLVLVLSTAGSVIISMLVSILPHGILDPVISGFVFVVISTISFAIIYKLLPQVDIAWKDVWLGALVTSVLFTLGRYALGLYFSISGIGTAFEAAGALAILLVGLYYITQIFLFGAIFTREYAMRFGSLVDPNENMDVVTDLTP